MRKNAREKKEGEIVIFMCGYYGYMLYITEQDLFS